MISVGRYTFSSWLRRGIGTRINQPDTLGAGGSGVNERATVPIDVTLNGDAINKNFALIGPGDIIGINPQMVVRTEPRNWISNFEPNYLAFVEFYDEDFLWRYTPAHPNGEKLSPWLALLVLEAPDPDRDVVGEYELTKRRDPLPTLKITVPEALPPLTQNWAFGHVSINEGHDNPTDFEEFLLSLRRARFRERRQDHQPPVQPAQARRRHRLPRLRRPCLRNRSDGRNRKTIRRASTHRHRRGSPDSQTRSPITTNGTSAPARTRTSSRW